MKPIESPDTTVRLPMPGSEFRLLTDAEIKQLGLPESPSWLEFFGPQPKPGTNWCEDTTDCNFFPEAIEFDGAIVKLRRKIDQKIVSIALDRLTGADQEIVHQQSSRASSLKRAESPKRSWRKWTDTTGKFCVEAEFLDFDRGVVKMRMRCKDAQKTISISMDRLMQNALGPGSRVDSIRKWTDKMDMSSIEATFREFDDGIVTLRRTDNQQTVSIPFDRLSEADRKFVLEQNSRTESTKDLWRDWTDSTGKFSINAAFLKLDEGIVKLKRKDNGKNVSIPFDRLAEADREAVFEQSSDAPSFKQIEPTKHTWREWTDTTGEYSIEAVFLEFDGRKVKLKRKDNKKNVSIPFDQLAVADRKIVWREHPKLRDRFHPIRHDDVQVIVHDGGRRMADRPPELVWATVTACEGEIFTARVLNQPHQLTSISKGSDIQFVVPDGDSPPLMVTAKYLQERPLWVIHPCSKCGLPELLDAPSDLIKASFPVADGSRTSAFSLFCPVCGGGQLLLKRSQTKFPDPPSLDPKRWWQFWK